ncbi:MAG: hypothetical protein ACRDJN_26950, partial [Chloroflexota bacterium]
MTPLHLGVGAAPAGCWTVAAGSEGETFAPSPGSLPASGPARLLYDDARNQEFPAVTVAGRTVGPGEAAWRAATAELAAAGTSPV